MKHEMAVENRRHKSHRRVEMRDYIKMVELYPDPPTTMSGIVEIPDLLRHRERMKMKSRQEIVEMAIDIFGLMMEDSDSDEIIVSFI